MLSKIFASLPFGIIWFCINLVLSEIISDKSLFTHNTFTLLCFASYLLCLNNWLSRGCKLFSFYVFFVAYCMLSNLGQSLMFYFPGLESLLTTYLVEDFGDIVSMLRFQSICIAALNLGTVIYLSNSKNVVTVRMQQTAYRIKKNSSKYDKYLDVVLFSCMTYFLFVCIKMVIMRQTMSYAAFFEAGRGQSQNVLINYADFFVIILSLRNIFNGRRIKAIYIYYALYIILYMMVGSRGLAIRYLAITLSTLPFVYPHLFTKKYNVIWIFSGLVGFYALNVISNTRSSSLNSNGNSESMDLMDGVIGTVIEMGRTQQPAVVAVYAIDHGHRNIYTIPSSILKAFFPLFSSTEFSRHNTVNLSDWVTDYAGIKGYGLGFSCIADAYVNFGRVGWIFFLFWGFFITFAENYAYHKLLFGNSILAFWLLTIVVTMIVYARDEFYRLQETLRWGLYLFIFSLVMRKPK